MRVLIVLTMLSSMVHADELKDLMDKNKKEEAKFEVCKKHPTPKCTKAYTKHVNDFNDKVNAYIEKKNKKGDVSEN